MPSNDLVVQNILSVHDTRTSCWAMPRMVHRSASGLVYMEKGSITYHFDDGDQTASDGDVLIFPFHLHYCGDKLTEAHHFYVIDFDTDPPEAFEGMHFPRILHGTEAIAQLFRQCAVCWESGRMETPLQCRSLLYDLLAQISRLCSAGSAKSAMICSVVRYIHQHYTEAELDVETLSREFHISSSQLRRLFHQELGVSPLQYILNLRLELAQNLLRHECLPVQTVALRCGFSSEFYFSRLFRQKVGVPPSSFR